MDARKHLIIIKGKDQTDSVASFQFHDGKCEVVYISAPNKTYSFQRSNVEILPLQKKIDPARVIVTANGQTISGIDEILDFGGYYRIVRNGKRDLSFRRSEVQFQQNCLADGKNQETFQYFKETAAAISLVAENGINILSMQYDKIQQVSEDTVLASYDEMYRAFLDCLADGQLHRSREVKDKVAWVFSVSEKERAEMLPSGKQQLFDNRIGWTRTYLKKAGLVQSPSRGIYVITPVGRQVLNENPPQIDNLYLQRFESFRKFISPNNNEETALSTPTEKVSGKTPQDILDEAFQQINTTLADDLLSEIMKQPPAFFEHLVVKLLTQMGYGGSVDHAGTVIGQTGDEGIDGIIREDKLGFSLIYIQAKRWDCDKTVGRPEIQKFVGALAGQGASKGLFITTAKFTKEARQYAEKQHTTKVVLVDGTTLAKLMIEYNLGVSTEATYEIKRIDSDFFAEDLD